jgi:putative ABC transport system permease protein
MESLIKDVRYGVRMLAQRPGFTAVAVLTLAIGIGANTAIFSVVNALLIRPLPFHQSEQLVIAFAKTSQDARDWIAYPDLQDFRSQNNLFTEMSAIVPQSINLTAVDEPTRVRGGFVSASFFKVLGVEPKLGRGFLPGEDEPGAERVVVVNYGLWQTRYGGDTTLIGKTMTLNGEVFTIVGIMPEGFRFPLDEMEVWIPFQHYPNYSLERKTPSAAVVARVKSGVSIEQARAEIDAIAGALARQYPDTNADRGVTITRFQEFLVEAIRPSLMILLSAVGLVLLIACANVANLLLARAIARQKEIALRAALGASRLRIVRQLLTETVMLSTAGGALGLLLGVLGVKLLVSISPGGLPMGATAGLDTKVLAFTLGLSMLTGLVFGLAPALKFSSPDLIEALKEGGRSSGEVTGRARLRSILVVSQIAIALVLLIGSGLMIKSIIKLVDVDPGFRPERLLTLEYRLPRNKYPKPAGQTEFHRRVVEQIRALAGVESAGAVRGLPLSGNGGSTSFVLPDRAEPPAGSEYRAQFNTSDIYYFETLGVPLLKGRAFTEQDTAESTPVVLINKTMAERYWPNDDPIGKQVSFLEPKKTATIIGVIGDVKQFGLDDETASQIYAPFAQAPFIFATLAIRTQTDPMSMAGAVRSAVWSVDKDQPMWKIRTMESLMENSVGQRRFIMYLLAGFSTLAMLLAAIGIYGVLAYSVTQRRHEIGVRMALGAERRDIFKIVVGQGMILTSIGIAVGLAAAFGVTRFLSSLLFGVDPQDMLTFAALSLLLALVALLACFIPARRATRVDPMVALRYE